MVWFFSKRSRNTLSSHALISISKLFDKNWLFWVSKRAGGLKTNQITFRSINDREKLYQCFIFVYYYCTYFDWI